MSKTWNADPLDLFGPTSSDELATLSFDDHLSTLSDASGASAGHTVADESRALLERMRQEDGE